MKDKQYQTGLRLPNYSVFVRNGNTILRQNLPFLIFEEYHECIERMRFSLVHLNPKTQEVGYWHLSSYSFDANLTEFLNCEDEEFKALKKRLTAIAKSNTLEGVIEGIKANLGVLVKCNFEKFDTLTDILEGKLKVVNNPEEFTRDLRRLFITSEDLLEGLLNNMSSQAKPQKIENLLRVLNEPLEDKQLPFKNPFQAYWTLISDLANIGVDIKKLCLPSLLNSNYKDLLEYAKIYRSVELFEYIFTVLLDNSNILQLYQGYLEYLAGDLVEDEFHSLHQKATKIQTDQLPKLFLNVVKRVENCTQLDLYSQILFYSDFWDVYNSVDSEGSSHAYIKLRLKYFFIDRFCLGDTTENSKKSNEEFLIDNLCLILSISADPSASLMDIDNEVTFLKEDQDSVMQIYWENFSKIFEKFKNVKKTLVQYMIDLKGFDLLCRLKFEAMEMTVSELEALILKNINNDNFEHMQYLAKSNKSLTYCYTLTELFKVFNKLRVKLDVKMLIPENSISNFLRLAISNLIQGNIESENVYFKDINHSLVAKKGEVKKIFKFLKILQTEIEDFRSQFLLKVMKDKNEDFFEEMYKVYENSEKSIQGNIDLVTIFIEELVKDDKFDKIYGVLKGLDEHGFEYEKIEGVIITETMSRILKGELEITGEKNDEKFSSKENLEIMGKSEKIEESEGKSLFSMAKQLAKSTFQIENAQDPSALIRWIWWPSARVEGLKALINLLRALKQIGVEFSKREIFSEKIQKEMIMKIWGDYFRKWGEKKGVKLRLVEVYRESLKFKRLFLEYKENSKNFENLEDANLNFEERNRAILLKYGDVDVFQISEFTGFLKNEVLKFFLNPPKWEDLTSLLISLSQKNQKELIVHAFKQLLDQNSKNQNLPLENLFSEISLKDLKIITGAKKQKKSKEQMIKFFMLNFNEDVSSINSYLQDPAIPDLVMTEISQKIKNSKFINKISFIDPTMLDTGKKGYKETVAKDQILTILKKISEDWWFIGLFLKYLFIEKKRSFEILKINVDLLGDRQMKVECFKYLMSLGLDRVLKKREFCEEIFEIFVKDLEGVEILAKIKGENGIFEFERLLEDDDVFLESELIWVLRMVVEVDEDDLRPMELMKIRERVKENGVEKLKGIFGNLGSVGFSKIVYEALLNRDGDMDLSGVKLLVEIWKEKVEEDEIFEDEFLSLREKFLVKKFQGKKLKMLQLDLFKRSEDEPRIADGDIFKLSSITAEQQTKIPEPLVANTIQNKKLIIPYMLQALRNEEFQNSSSQKIDSILKNLRAHLKAK